MKKRLLILFTVLVALAIFASTAFAAPANSKSVSLISVEYQEGGIVLMFETSELTQADLKNATFHADSSDQNMYCTFVDDTTIVRCTVAKKLAGLGGFKATLAGFIFWGELPQERSFGLKCGEGQTPWYSLNVYEEGQLVESGDLPAWFWKELEQSGLLEYLAELYGASFEITDTFCGPDDLGMPA